MYDSIPARLQKRGETHGHEVAHYTKSGSSWEPTTYKEFADEVKQAAKALIHLGLESQHTVCILGFNRSEWVVFDVAAMSAGGAPAGIYTTCSPPEVQYIIDHAEARIVLLENEDQWAKVEAELANLPKLEHVVMMKGTKVEHDKVMSWEDFLAKGDEVEDAVFDERLGAIDPNQLATLIYTSGTTGPPKGVMLSFSNLTETSNLVGKVVQVGSDDSTLSYLPLSHIAEQMFTIHLPITYGVQVYFAESIDKVADNIKEVQPTVVFGVPRIWEKFYAGVTAKMKEATGMKKRIADWAQRVGREANAIKNQGKQPSGFLAWQYNTANKLVYSKVKPALGLGRARYCISGAAPIAKEVLEFFSGLDVIILEVYGQSEDSGPTTFNQPGNAKFGSVGPAVPTVEVKIADDGEIVVKGPNVFLGYYKDEAATNDALIDGWLHSGDLGKFDEQGFLNITGRKKDIIITAGGKNIAPKNIEAALKNTPFIEEAVVIGDRRKFLSALLFLDQEAAKKWASENGEPTTDLRNNAKLKALIQADVDGVNKLFARVEHVRKWTVPAKPLSIEGGELTPTLKVKRAKVNAHYEEDIESMYAEGDAKQAESAA
ncbi:MAG: long-chain fatty acid--CoA ligase [Deltaproteobacteria bacterium]